jgi:hypothetical protein
MGDVGERIIAQTLLAFAEVHDVTPVPVLDTVQADVWLGGPKRPSGGIAEDETVSIYNLIQIVILK